MKLRIAAKIYKQLDKGRWSEETLRRARHRMERTVSGRETRHWWTELFTPANIFYCARLEFNRGVRQFEAKWNQQ